MSDHADSTHRDLGAGRDVHGLVVAVRARQGRSPDARRGDVAEALTGPEHRGDRLDRTDRHAHRGTHPVDRSDEVTAPEPLRTDPGAECVSHREGDLAEGNGQRGLLRHVDDRLPPVAGAGHGRAEV
ncbi:hypothetical protein Cus16_2931 [Curtobacterium sp. ER1/6]|nr:hypothetical protein Cus16_2931 [Curtobacterium sp. ER1/6]